MVSRYPLLQSSMFFLILVWFSLNGYHRATIAEGEKKEKAALWMITLVSTDFFILDPARLLPQKIITWLDFDEKYLTLKNGSELTLIMV
jgi:hypothetical protein